MNKQSTKLATLVEDIEIQNEYLKNEAEEVYEVVFGDNGIKRYLHEELIELLAEMGDCYEWVCNFKSQKAMYKDLRKLRGEPEDEPTSNDGGIPIPIHRSN